MIPSQSTIESTKWLILLVVILFSCHVLEFEERFRLPLGLILRSLEANGETGAWAKLERGEITEQEFLQPFSEECSRQVMLLLPVKVKLNL